MIELRVCAAMVLIGATVAAKPVVTIHPDDIMDVPHPTAALARWTDAPGRRAVPSTSRVQRCADSSMRAVVRVRRSC